MAKIGIITYHFARNYGAVLQCYALQETLKKLGHDVQIINFRSKKQIQNNSLFHKRDGFKNIIMNIMLFPFIKKRICKEKKYTDFCQNKIKTTREVQTLEELKQGLEEWQFDYVISGSDQVWNPHIDDFNEAFFLPIETSAQKLTYAASIGKATLDVLTSYQKEIEKFTKISVREEETAQVLEQMGFKNIPTVVDPVLLAEPSIWTPFIKSEIQEKYVLCYYLNKKNLKAGYQVARQIAKEKNCQVKVINARFSLHSFRKGTIIDVGPEEYVSLFYHAEAICTDSFHGTVFSCIFQKDFYTLERTSNKTDKRKTNLLLKLGLSSRILYVPFSHFKQKKKIDYKEVTSKIEMFRKESLDFLKNSIHK